MPDFDISNVKIRWWHSPLRVPNIQYICGYCGQSVSSVDGYMAGTQEDGRGNADTYIRICPNCHGPTVFDKQKGYFPKAAPGSSIENVPDDLYRLYNEARNSAGAGANTGAVLICRKMLMNIAVDKGAEEGKSFVHYVEYLTSKGYVPPDDKAWVDYIRKRGNEANHQIALMSAEDANALITFVEMILKFIYEFSSRVPSPQSTGGGE